MGAKCTCEEHPSELGSPEHHRELRGHDPTKTTDEVTFKGVVCVSDPPLEGLRIHVLWLKYRTIPTEMVAGCALQEAPLLPITLMELSARIWRRYEHPGVVDADALDRRHRGVEGVRAVAVEAEDEEA